MTIEQEKTRNALSLGSRLTAWTAAGLKGISRFIPSKAAAAVVALLVWVLSGVFIVGPDEIGVVKTFGRKVRTEKPGLHYHLPQPVSQALTIKIHKINRLEFGVAWDGVDGDVDNELIDPSGPNDTLLLTGDHDLIALKFIVQYKIKKPNQYLFRTENPERTIRAAARAAFSETIGGVKLDEALTTGQQKIVKEAKTRLQSTLDLYKIGVKVTAVQLLSAHPPIVIRSAFKKAATAEEEKKKIINGAESYAMETAPLAQGEAAVIVAEAEAYRENVVQQAKGDADQFLALLAEYQKAPDITRRRLYLEGMERVLSNAGKIVLESQKQSVLPLYNLNEAGVDGGPRPEPVLNGEAK